MDLPYNPALREALTAVYHQQSLGFQVQPGEKGLLALHVRPDSAFKKTAHVEHLKTWLPSMGFEVKAASQDALGLLVTDRTTGERIWVFLWWKPLPMKPLTKFWATSRIPERYDYN